MQLVKIVFEKNFSLPCICHQCEITYFFSSVRPLRKSWKNIRNLSGGEKTLSSLSLVFALHYYRSTPFFVMDEIDAALDYRNVSIIGSYIKVCNFSFLFFLNCFVLHSYTTFITVTIFLKCLNRISNIKCYLFIYFNFKSKIKIQIFYVLFNR